MFQYRIVGLRDLPEARFWTTTSHWCRPDTPLLSTIAAWHSCTIAMFSFCSSFSSAAEAIAIFLRPLHEKLILDTNSEGIQVSPSILKAVSSTRPLGLPHPVHAFHPGPASNPGHLAVVRESVFE